MFLEDRIIAYEGAGVENLCRLCEQFPPTIFLLRIVIVPIPSLSILLGQFLKLITLNLLNISHNPRDVHISIPNPEQLVP